MRRIVLSAFALLCVAAPAAAAPLVLPENSPIFIQFRNIEQVDFDNDIVVPYLPAVGLPLGLLPSGNWGVFNVSTVQAGAVGVPNTTITGGPAFFTDDGPGGAQGQITGIFFGAQINPADPTEAAGGYIDLYWEDAGADEIDAACLTGGVTCPANAATVGLFTDGTFLARLEFASGIDPADPSVFIKSSTAPTIGVTGLADSFANVVGGTPGPWSDVLNGDWFNTAFGTRDIRFRNVFSSLPNWNGGVNGSVNGLNPANATLGFESTDPATVFTASVPEPTSMALFGIALAALGIQQRRRLRASRS